VAIEPCSAQDGQGRPRLEAADIFRAASEAYRDRYAPTPDQRKVMAAIEQCRTAALGGHLDVCKKCGHKAPAYNSCRNRHCPKCQALAQARWIEQRRQRIIPTKYFHVVFTLPEELRTLARVNPKEMYDLVLESAARTLLDFGRSRLHAQLGVTAVLHTWTRELRFHPHAHCIVTAGGLDEQGHWIPARSRFLFPVKAMSRVFRGKLLERLESLHQRKALAFAGRCAELADRAKFDDFKDRLYRKEWVVYAKRPFGGAEHVFQYLGRYTLHVLPAGFVKIRHYGLVAAANVTTKLETARRCLLTPGQDEVPQAPPPETPPSWRDLVLALTGIDLLVCPVCGSRSMERRPLRDSTTGPWPPDTS